MDLLSKTPKFPWSGAVPTSKPSTTTTSTNTSQHLQPNPLPNPTNHPNVTASSTPVPGPASPVLQTCSKEKEPSTSEPTSSSGSSSNTSKPKPRGFTDSLVDPFFKSDTTFDSFRFLKTLGCGTFGKVKLAEYVQTRRKVAIKLIEKANIKTEKQRNCVRRELRLMVLLHNPNIIEVKDVIETDSKIGIVMEYAEKGELFDYIVQKKNLSEREARELFQQILDAIEYCHEHCIIHRDLKPENLLLDKDMKIKLVDFGFGNTFDGYRMLDTFCGSPFYAAPEMIKGIRYSGPDSDIWSLGVILYAMLCGKLPFDAQDLRKLYEKIAVGVFKCPSFLSADAVDLLHTMIRVDPQQRASIDQIKRHPWMQPMALPKQPFVIQIHPPINPVYVDMIVSFGYPKDEVMDRLKGSLSTPPLMTASPYSMTPFTLVQPKKMHPILGYYDLICGSPLVQAKLKPHTSIDSMYSSLLNVEGPRRTKLSFQTWSVTTEFGAGEVMSIVEDVLNQANVVWKFDKNVFSCKKDGKRFDLVWNALSHSVFIRQMHGTVLGCGAFGSYVLAEIKRALDDLDEKTYFFKASESKRYPEYTSSNLSPV